MFGVTSEGIDVRSWLKKLSGVLSYPLANQVLPRYRPIGGAVPSTFIIDRKGVLRVSRAGAFSETAFRKTVDPLLAEAPRSEEHTSELQSLMRISYAVFCLQKKNTENARHRLPHGPNDARA